MDSQGKEIDSFGKDFVRAPTTGKARISTRSYQVEIRRTSYLLDIQFPSYLLHWSFLFPSSDQSFPLEKAFNQPESS